MGVTKQLCRFYLPDQGARVGWVVDGNVYDLTASGLSPFSSLTALLQASTAQPIDALLQEVAPSSLPVYAYAALDVAPDDSIPHLLPLVDRQEVWAAGVTYAWSREARVRESQSRECYVRVYDAERPELFFKSLGEKVVGPNDWIGLRGDSRWSVPEPELALVVNPAMHVVGYTVSDDVSSRDIEGENPLYLPQAKVYRHSCALGSVITLADGAIDGQNLNVRLTVRRGGHAIFEGETFTGQMHRRLDELVGFLARYDEFPHGVVLLTGTGIVPGDDFALRDGDEVVIEIEAIGILRNSARQM
jgi:2-dehydro-3-deoxy-D-arabinonate dehydratase